MTPPTTKTTADAVYGIIAGVLLVFSGVGIVTTVVLAWRAFT